MRDRPAERVLIEILDELMDAYLPPESLELDKIHAGTGTRPGSPNDLPPDSSPGNQANSNEGVMGSADTPTRIEPAQVESTPSRREDLNTISTSQTAPAVQSVAKGALCVGVIGYGYWGPNVVRNLHAIPGFRVHTICDKSLESLNRAQEACPSAKTTTHATEVLESPDIDVVAVITPLWTHYEFAKLALLSGKHVFVASPFTYASSQAEELIEVADRMRLKIMVNHPSLFTWAVGQIRGLVDSGTLGDLYYYDSLRVNLGLFQHDLNVVWNLAPHDLSIMDYILKDTPEAIVATGESHLTGHEDVAYITLYFPRNIIAHVNVNSLSPVKIRTTLIGGEKKMIVWNDLDPDEKIKVYDKGVSIKNRENLDQLLLSYGSGDMLAPHVQQVDALNAELSYFRECISQDSTPLNDGAAGLRVVRMLEAIAQSMKTRSAVLLEKGESNTRILQPRRVHPIM